MNIRHQVFKHDRKFAAGFTAIELMVVVSVAAILAAMAAPSFTPVIENWRVHQSVDELRSTLEFARSEAIKRSGGVVIQKISNKANGCSTASGIRDWDCGWIVCRDVNDSGTCNPTEPVLRRVETSAKVHVSRTGGGASIRMNRWGLVDGPLPGFNLVPLNKSVSHASTRGVCMSLGGRIRVIPQEAIPCDS
ncbi:MAG: prepilin-type N-terminal cleavage/methylation domain-containing protein [Alcaligenaceae bacterium]|nr:MAG: prepilin-type N-terminal cleavage/methylation domain-containing protein [Alcaligenaceae bacterium]